MRQKIYKEIYPIEKILPLINPNKGRIVLDGDIVRVGNMRLQTFKVKGITCVGCGIKGSFFRKEQQIGEASNIWHIHLYAVNKKKNNILMTMDHIFPASRGGHSIIENLQPMCENCNNKKKDNTDWKVTLIYKVHKIKRFVYGRIYKRYVSRFLVQVRHRYGKTTCYNPNYSRNITAQ